ncbi:partner of bursicon-like [Artemia franciscana]|uniref:Bursicon beta n=1 Tax=Artemia franciscana TaxID=6661 RepID=A0AA88H6X5_ARTSF|nr:hypothetical protein QYM36_016067 [Artemia franciscana]
MLRRSSVASLLLTLSISNVVTRGDSCETLPSSVHITKEEYTESGSLARTCEGEVAVTKCEGTCNSQVQPSVNHPTGFLKECLCCREGFLRERRVSLLKCYDSDGNQIKGERGVMEVKLREPSDCKCQRCGELVSG